jgi:hypothetical protein
MLDTSVQLHHGLVEVTELAVRSLGLDDCWLSTELRVNVVDQSLLAEFFYFLKCIDLS